jgi:CheY-like chemotaxis protein/anti-anti-sigma regulatory factor
MSQKKTILVVDDQTNVRNILEFNLKRRGFDVLSAQDGLAAITMATSRAPNLILLDIMMPGIDGFQVLEKLRGDAKTAQIPILVVSAKGTENDILRAMKLGAKDYIVKPFNLEQLMQKAFRLIEGAAQTGGKEENGAGAAASPGLAAKASWPTWTLVAVGPQYPADDEALMAHVVRLAEAGALAVILDLNGTGDIPALAFGKLARAQQQAKKSSSVIRLAGASDAHRKTLQEANFLKHFDLFATPADAMKEAQA